MITVLRSPDIPTKYRFVITLQTAENLTCLCNLGIASDGLKGRVFEVSLADLQNDEVAFRKFKLVTEDVQGKNCLTNFHGMDLTRDKMCSMVKKWQVKTKLVMHGFYLMCVFGCRAHIPYRKA